MKPLPPLYYYVAKHCEDFHAVIGHCLVICDLSYSGRFGGPGLCIVHTCPDTILDACGYYMWRPGDAPGHSRTSLSYRSEVPAVIPMGKPISLRSLAPERWPQEYVTCAHLYIIT